MSEDGTIRITVSSNQPLVSTGIRVALEAADEVEVVGEARTGPETLALLARLDPDAALLDTQLDGMQSLALLARVRARCPRTEPILFAEKRDLVHAQTAFAFGACAYVDSGIDARDLGAAIRLALRGTAYLARGLPALEGDAALEANGLTKRELSVLQALARGLTNREIARELWITDHTVKFHLTNVYRKAGVANRTDAARWAALRGIH